MIGQADLVVRVMPTSGDERQDLLDLTRRIRSELLTLDIEAAEPVIEGPVPDGSKGIPGLAETLGVRLGKATLKALIARLRDWAARSGRNVEVTIDGDTIKLTGATAGQQEQIVNVWLARHAPNP